LLLEGEQDTPLRIGHDDEPWGGIEQRAALQHADGVGAGAGMPGGKQDGVGFVGVQGTEGAVADRTVLDGGLVLKLQLAEAGELLWRRGGAGAGGKECDGAQDGAGTAGKHVSPLFLC
jgi:hypothetical protein